MALCLICITYTLSPYLVDRADKDVSYYFNVALQVISYLRGPLLFIFNFHPSNSYEKYSVGVEEAGEYQVGKMFFYLPKIMLKI